MSVGTGIEWAEATWNCLVGCTPVSAGCLNCYAAGDVWRHSHPCKSGPRTGQPNIPEFVGLTVKRNGRAVFNGQVRMLEDKLTVPLKRKKATRWFVNSLSDLFHESVPFEFIDRVMAVAALCPQHQFLVLTKRPERMEDYLRTIESAGNKNDIFDHLMWTAKDLQTKPGSDSPRAMQAFRWPLPNVWLGTSCEDQAAADARIPHLLRCPAAVRFLSCEPLLGPIDLGLFMCTTGVCPDCGHPDESHEWEGRSGGCQHGDGSEENPICGCRRLRGEGTHEMGMPMASHRIDWVIVGCESRGNFVGRFAEGYAEAARGIIAQCAGAGVACFNKQTPVGNRVSGNPAEWAEDLRVRKMPGEGKGSGIGDQASGGRG